MKIFLYTGFALVAFALNSILCRLALKTDEIDAASFTLIRIVSGAAALVSINAFFGAKKSETKGGNWFSAFFLFAYAACFSFAYVDLTAATGALLLFGSVQATMIAATLFSGERLKIVEWLGLFVALCGLIYLVFPNLSAPPLFASLLMSAAGIAWGFYTLRGRASANPLAETSGNFLRAAPFAAFIILPTLAQTHFSQKGIALAVLSGAVASGIGYAVWYAALRFHTATRAAVLQLSVPALAGFGGVVLLDETISLRLFAASFLIIGGIALTIFGRKYVKNIETKKAVEKAG